MIPLSSVIAERGVLSGIINFGSDVYYDVSSFLSENTFTVDSNQYIYKCVEYVFKNREREKSRIDLDIPTIHSAAKSIGLQDILLRKEEVEHLKAIINYPVKMENVGKLARQIRKLEVARNLRRQLELASDELLNITGDEPIVEILNKAEEPIFNLSAVLKDEDNSPKKIGDGMKDYIQDLRDNPVDHIYIPSGFSIWDEATGGFAPATVTFIAARMKKGKAQSINSLVYTPKGPVKMGDIKVGDVISHPFNNTTKVIAIHPQGIKNRYKVSFRDGSYTECCDEHLWNIIDCYGKQKIMSTKDILEYKSKYHKNIYGPLKKGKTNYRFSIPLSNIVNFYSQEIEINPYLLGVLLGDGSFRGDSIRLTSNDKSIVEESDKTLKQGYFFKQQSRPMHYILYHGRNKKHYYKKILKEYGLWGKKSKDKFIPKKYIYNSIKNRQELLQGLMDTDGTVDKNGNCSYSTKSHKLALGIQELVQSLGGICTIRDKKTKYNGKIFDSYVLRIMFNDNRKCFKLSRKVKRCKKRTKPNLKRFITKIERIEDTEMKCITVDAKDGLYLTDSFIVTHNSALALNFADNISSLGIPVLVMDTELVKTMNQNRLLAKKSGITINTIKTGQFAQNTQSNVKIDKAIQDVENRPYFHHNISGMPFENQLATMRNWVIKEVGLKPDGTANPCLVIYDYIKLMDSKDIKNTLNEHQIIGFMMTALHNFAVHYNIPLCVFGQTNRSNVEKSDSSVIGLSDRIAQLATSISLLVETTDEEIQELGPDARNRKVYVLDARDAPALEYGDYILLGFDGSRTTFTEHKTRSQILEGKKDKEDDGFVVDDEINFE